MSNSVDIKDESASKIHSKFIVSSDDESSFEIIEKHDESESDSDGSIIIVTGTTSPNLAKLKEASSENDESNFEVIEKCHESESIIIPTGTTLPNLEKLKNKSLLSFRFKTQIIFEQENEGRNKCAENSDSDDSDSFVVIPIQKKAQFLHLEPQESSDTLRGLSEDLQNRSDFNQVSEFESGNTDTDSNDSDSFIFIQQKNAEQYKKFFECHDEKSYSSNDTENANNEEEETDDLGKINIIEEGEISQLEKKILAGNTVQEGTSRITLVDDNKITRKYESTSESTRNEIVITSDSATVSATHEIKIGTIEESAIINDLHSTVHLKPENPIKEEMVKDKREDATEVINDEECKEDSILYVDEPKNGVTTNWQELSRKTKEPTLFVGCAINGVATNCPESPQDSVSEAVEAVNEYQEATNMDTEPNQVTTGIGKKIARTRVSHKKEHQDKRDLSRDFATFVLFCIALEQCMKIVWFIYQLLNPLEFLIPIISYWEECYWLKLLVFCVLITRHLRNWKLVFYLWFLCFVLIQLLKLIAANSNLDNRQVL